MPAPPVARVFGELSRAASCRESSVIASCCLAGICLTTASAADLREENIQHAGVAFRVVRIAPEKLQVVWKDAQGMPYRTFGRVQAAFKAQRKTLKFIMNAGIFQSSGAPCGLQIEVGKEVHPMFLSRGCRNAVFLDGNISQMAVNPAHSIESYPLGAMFVVAE